MSGGRNLPAYTLGSSTVERERLRSQADDLRPHSEELFGRIGVKPGWNALDLGCGPCGNLGLLAELTRGTKPGTGWPGSSGRRGAWRRRTSPWGGG